MEVACAVFDSRDDDVIVQPSFAMSTTRALVIFADEGADCVVAGVKRSLQPVARLLSVSREADMKSANRKKH